MQTQKKHSIQPFLLLPFHPYSIDNSLDAENQKNQTQTDSIDC